MIIKNTVKILVVCGLACCTFFACKKGESATTEAKNGKAAAGERPLGYAGKNLYEAPVGLITPMGKNSNPVFNEGMKHYANKDFEQAIQVWRGIPDRNSANDTLNFYMGSANFALDNFSKATTYYLKARNLKGSKFTDMSLWYLGVCSYKLGANDLAKEFLKECENPLKERLLHEMQ